MPRSAGAIPAAPARRRLDLVNAHTGERFSGPYRSNSGPIPEALRELSHFLRDFRRGAAIAIDIELLDFLASVLDAVGAGRATVLSAYRTPETNAMLARTTLGVAERSQHLYGRALDIYLPARLEDAMLAARAMRRGGVGWYPNSRFIHLDTGPVRNWSLGGKGLGKLLLDNKPSRYFPENIEISPDGEFHSRRSGAPVSPTDRLAIHRLLQDALKSPPAR
ncbi:MAG: YcbK family protein [Alphaproteobacteria bacterium]